ncbi:YadA-like family protein [Phascolarctobacterium faecium]|uniref:YadA-like family protein n=1 Tax=Phascolarctobacterium faecium TaxID=33025 RepID=UPI001EDCC12E|nr:YadA-like family protein [Phascolarctobacterium faecium]
MSKREIRAKRLVAAVLLAISVQMWSAPPLWAAEASVQTETSAAGEAKETKETKNAKAADSETGGEADAGEEETVVVPVIGYSTRSAAGSDYGVMPLADMAVDGALTGVTGINDAKFYADTHDLLLGYDAKSQGTGTVALGSDANAGGQYSTAIGASASATAENSSALGMYARAGFKDSVAIGFSSNATADNMVSFGVTENGGSTWTTRRSLEGIANIDMHGALTGVTGINNVTFILDEENSRVGIGNVDLPEDAYNGIAIGANTTVTASYGIAIGGASSALGENSIAIGSDALAKAANGISLGEYAKVGEEHTGSVAIGSRSTTTAANQVSFGQWSSTKNEWTNRRSLAGISDIDMEGTINLGGTWTKNATSGEYESNGKGELTGVTKINGVVFQYIEDNPGLAIGGYMSGDYYYSLAIGGGAGVAADNATAVGFSTSADGENSTAIGNASTVYEKSGTAIGASAYVQKGHTGSVAIGYDSATTAADQVAFGTGTVTTVDGAEVVTWTNRRSLAGISDIDMAGNISLGGEWKENATAGIYESNGKGELNGVTSINGVIFAKDSMNNQDGLLIGTLAPDTYYSGSWSVMIGTNIDNQAIDAVGIGNDIKLTGDGSVAIGNSAEAISSGGYPTAIGFMAHAVGIDAVAIGANSNAEHEYSVALGDDSSTSAEKQVSFGNNDLFRSLVNVADIDMHGNISLGGVLDWDDEKEVYKSNNQGALTGVTSINGLNFLTNEDESIGIGVVSYLGDHTIAFGFGTKSSDFSVVVGSNAEAADICAVAVGDVAIAHNNATAVGFSAQALSTNSVVFGGYSSVTKAGEDGTALGTRTIVAHSNSVAVGAASVTSAADQVNFGHKAGDENAFGGTYGTDMFRSLAGISDIEMHGALTGVTGINGVTVSGTDASTGLTVGGNAVIGKTNTPFSSTGFAVDKEGAVTAKTVNGATITGTGFNGVTLSADGKVNGAAITSNSFNGVTLEKGADSHYKVGGVDVTKMQTDVAGKADAATTLTGYGITDAYTKTETDTAIGKKADKATTLTGYGIADAYTKTETDTAVGKKADKATTLTGYGITDAYTKTAADEKITAATADMATKTQVTADIGTAKTALESAYQAADNALSGRATALETKTAKFNTAGDNLTGMANITSTAATLGGVGFASAGVMTGVSSIDGIAIDASRNLSKAGTYNGVTVAAAGISGTSVFNGAAITNNSFNGVTLEKGADNHYKVGGVDVSALKTTVDSISADGVGTADTAGIKRDTTGTATTSIETNTKISSSGITTNKVTVSGATATTLENGKLTVGAAAVQNTGFAVGSSSLNNGSLTVDGNNKLTTAGLTASKVTVGAVIVSGGKVSGLTDAALSAVSTEAVTGKQLNATNTTVAGKADKATTLTGYGITDAYTITAADAKITAATADMATKTQVTADIGAAKTALESAYKAADTQIRTDFAAADTTLQNNIDTKVAQTAYDTKMSALDSADTALGSRATALETVVNDSTTGLAAVNTKVGALDTAYKAADNALSGRATALETATTGMTYAADKTTTTFAGGVTAAVLTAGEFKVGATGFGFGNDGALTAKTVNGIEIKKDESKVMVGGIDLTALSNGDVVTDNTKGIGRNQDTATTTIETNTAISSSGITTNAVTASGTVKAGEFVEGSQKLSDKYAAKTALADYTTTTDMNTKFADYATTTAVDTKLADYAKSDSVYSKAAADTAFAKAGDVDTLKTTVGDTDGGLVKDVKDLQSGKADNATTLAGYGIADAYTQTEINEKIVEATKDLATSATVTDIQSGLDEVTGKTAGLSYDTASGSSKFSGSVVIGNEGAKTHTQITDDAIIFGEGTDKQVTVDANGIHVGKKAAGGISLYTDADGTHIDHTSLVTGSVTADNLNGVAISGNATDGLSVGGVSIKALSERLDSLEQDGVATADMGGIKRTDVVENSGKTIIEDTTSFTKDGLKTANLEAATAALGGVNFAAGAVTGVSSINGVVFGSDGKIGGVSLSGGKVDGVDVGWLDQRVKSLEDNGTGGGGTGGGGSSANTSGIHKPDRDTTNIEGNTSITTDGIDTNKVNASDAIVVADGEKNKTVISKDGILVAEGEKNQVKINEDGIHVGKNSSVVNDTDGFITDKGLYIGVSSSSDTSTAKFSVAPNGNLSSKAGDYGFSNTSADGAKFTHSGDTAYGTGSQLDTTIQGNKVTTGRIDTDELYVDGNKVTVAGGTIGQTDAVDNHLSGTDADGNTVTNDFKTSAVNGTTQAAEKTSADGKESTKTVNNTSAGGTSVTTSRTTTDSKDNVTVKESSFGTNEKGMTLSTSNKVTDKDCKVTKDTSGTTTMTGDSISVSKTTMTTEKDADGNEKEVTKTSGTTIGSGEVTLKREDGSTIEVGSAIEGMQSDMRELDGRVNRMGVEIKEVGALSAALAGLHPQPENANSRADFAMAMGSYEGKQALAVGGFYRPDKRTMLSIGASTTSSKHMMNMGISIALDRLPEAERKAKEAAKAAGVEQETLNRVLERLAALEQDNRRLQADNEKRDVAYEKLAADYTQLKEKYIEETVDRQQPEQAEAEE